MLCYEETQSSIKGQVSAVPIMTSLHSDTKKTLPLENEQ